MENNYFIFVNTQAHYSTIPRRHPHDNLTYPSTFALKKEAAPSLALRAGKSEIETIPVPTTQRNLSAWY